MNYEDDFIAVMRPSKRLTIYGAVLENDPDMLKKALKDPMYTADERKENCDNALAVSSFKGCHDCVHILLSEGANPNYDDGNGNILIRASEQGFLEVVEHLINFGAHINGVDSNTRTALHWTSMNGHLSVVELLLKHGGKPDKKDALYGFTPIMLAARLGHIEVLQKLIEHCDNPKQAVNICDNHGETALFESVRNGQLRCAKFLIDQYADINLTPSPIYVYALPYTVSAKESLLQTAIQRKKHAMVKLLIQENCNIHKIGAKVQPPDRLFRFCNTFKEGLNTPIELAIWLDHYTSAKMLFLAGGRIPFSIVSTENILIVGHAEGIQSQEFMDWMDKKLHHARTLKDLSRMQIRDCIGQHLKMKISPLPLPKSLLEYMLIPELDDI